MYGAFNVLKASVGTKPVISHTDPTNGAAQGSDGDRCGARRQEPGDSEVASEAGGGE